MCAQPPFGSSPYFFENTHNVRSVAAGRVDGDGDLDVLFGNSREPTTLCLHSEAGFIQAPPALFQPVGAPETRTVSLGDVDDDGNLDLSCGNSGERATLYSSRDRGTRLELDPTWPTMDGAVTLPSAWRDVDRDGDLDLVCGKAGTPQATLFYNSGTHLDSSQNFVLLRTTWSVALGDVNGDGYLDLVCGKNGRAQTCTSTRLRDSI